MFSNIELATVWPKGRALSSAPARRTATMSCNCAYCDFEILPAREGKDTHVRARAPFRSLFLIKVSLLFIKTVPFRSVFLVKCPSSKKRSLLGPVFLKNGSRF